MKGKGKKKVWVGWTCPIDIKTIRISIGKATRMARLSKEPRYPEEKKIRITVEEI